MRIFKNQLFVITCLFCFLNVTVFIREVCANPINKNISIKLEAESSLINSDMLEIVTDDRLSRSQGVSLMKSATAAIDGERVDADLTFNLNLPEGKYTLTTFAFTDAEGAELMKNATSKYESMYMRLQVDKNKATKRVIYVPWDRPRQVLGNFSFDGDNQELKIWLPRGVRLDYIIIETYNPPSVPKAVVDYSPPFTPPTDRPRLWVNSNTLDIVRNRLFIEENKKVWDSLKNRALKPYVVKYIDDKEVSHNAKLETTAREKAFYYLMTNDEQVGRESIELMTEYLSRVEFGNLLDITREIGRAIYSASLVYDWCYKLLNEKDQDLLYNNLIRLSEEMEVGWPPFRQSILTGHGSEAQITRDLLSMSIAIYDEDPLPYQYCSYRILEELVPMRNWQYQSPRHNQGVSYAGFRSIWDMHAAWLYLRMSGREVFNSNIKKLPLHWLYLRLPDGEMLRDGDGIVQGLPSKDYYWRNPQIMFLFYTYASDPIVKGEFNRQGGRIDDYVLYLLLNDPQLEPQESLSSLPLTIDFGPIVGSMVARTGWDISNESNDVVAEIKGGGYHFGNHQHSDAGALQIYYRGLQVADIGIYGFYGTPYDMNFNKRSISHSMMLAVDPEEKFLNTESNDGGARFNQSHPGSITIAKTDPRFNNGTILSTDFGPSHQNPIYSYFSVNLKGAYSDKIEDYVRQFSFINLNNDTIPAVIIMSDKMITTNLEFKKYWQINTLNPPEFTNNTITLSSSKNGKVGKTVVQLLEPNYEEYSTTVLSGDDANSSFEFKYEIPGRIKQNNYPEASAHRIMVSPINENKEDDFLSFFQVSDENVAPLEVKHKKHDVFYEIVFLNYFVCMNRGHDLIKESISFDIPNEYGSSKVIINGVKEGKWNITNYNGVINFDVDVLPNKNTIYFQSSGGDYYLTPL